MHSDNSQEQEGRDESMSPNLASICLLNVVLAISFLAFPCIVFGLSMATAHAIWGFDLSMATAHAIWGFDDFPIFRMMDSLALSITGLVVAVSQAWYLIILQRSENFQRAWLILAWVVSVEVLAVVISAVLASL